MQNTNPAEDELVKLEEETNAQLAKGSSDETPSPETATGEAETEPQTTEEPEGEAETTPEKAEKPDSEEPEGETEKPQSRAQSRIRELNAKYRDLESKYNDLLTRNQPNYGQMDAGSYAATVAAQSEQRARAAVQQELEAQKQEAEAYGAYPELNPSNEKYDPSFEEAVAGVIVANRNSTPDRTKWITAKQAADKVAKLAQKWQAQGASQALDEAKAKASVGEPAGSKNLKPSPEDMTLEELEETLPKADSYFKPVSRKS